MHKYIDKIIDVSDDGNYRLSIVPSLISRGNSSNYLSYSE